MDFDEFMKKHIEISDIEFEIRDELHRLQIWQWLFVGVISIIYGAFTSLYFSLVGMSIFMYSLLLIAQKYKIYFLKNGEILFLSSNLVYRFAGRKLEQELKIIKSINEINIYRYYFGPLDSTNGNKIKQILLKMFNYLICCIGVVMQFLFVVLRISKSFKLNVLSIKNNENENLLISLALLNENEKTNLENFLKNRYDINLDNVKILNLYN